MVTRSTDTVLLLSLRLNKERLWVPVQAVLYGMWTRYPHVQRCSQMTCCHSRPTRCFSQTGSIEKEQVYHNTFLSDRATFGSVLVT